MPQAAALTPFQAAVVGSITSTLSSSIIQSVFHKDPVRVAKSTIRAAINDARVIYGKRRDGGQIVFGKVLGDDLHLVYAISEGRLDSITDFSIDGISAGEYENPETGVKTIELDVLEPNEPRLLAPNEASHFHGSIEIREYFAADGSQGDELQAIFPEYFTDDHKKAYLSYVYVKLIQNYGLRKVWSKPPELSFLTNGVKFTWPGQSVPTFAENTAAIEWDWLTRMREIPETAIPESFVLSAVALSSAQTTVNLPPGYEEYNPTSTRYLTDCVLTYGDNVHDVQKALDFCWNGHIVNNGGQIIFRPGAGSNLYPVSDTITVDDIVERGVVEFDLQLKDKFNAIHMSLEQSSAKNWEEQDLPILHDRETQAISDQLRILEMGTFRHMSNPVAAVRMQAAELRKIRASAVYPYRLRAGENFKNLGILPGDRRWINDPENGLDPSLPGATPFKVMKTILHPDWTIYVELREDPDEIYQDDPITLPLVPRALKPGISDDPPPRPTGVIVLGSHFIREDDGSQVGVFVVSWDRNGYGTVLQLTNPTNITLPQVNIYTDTANLPVDRSGRYKLDIWHENSFGVRGPKYVANEDDEDFYVETEFSDKPPTPIITDIQWNGRYVRFTMLTHAQKDVVAADVRYVRSDLGTTNTMSDFTDDNWGLRNQLDTPPVVPGLGLRSILVWAGPLPTEGRYRFGVRLINRAGQESGIANDPRTFNIHLTIVAAQEIVFGGDVNGWPIDQTGNASRGIEQMPRPSVDALKIDDDLQNIPASPAPAVLVPDHRLGASTTEGRLDGRSGWLVGPRTDNAIWISAALPLVYYYGASLNSFGTFGLDATAYLQTTRGSVITPSSTGLDVLIAFSDSTASINFNATAADLMLGGGAAPANVSYKRLIVDGVARHQSQTGRFTHFRMALRMKAGFQGAGVRSLILDIDGQI